MVSGGQNNTGKCLGGREVRVLAIGDIVGRPGREGLKPLCRTQAELNLDLVIANGRMPPVAVGLTEGVAQEIWGAGVDIITSGNHIGAKGRSIRCWSENSSCCAQLIILPGTPATAGLFGENDLRVAVVNLAGRTFLEPLECPFRLIDSLLPE